MLLWSEGGGEVFCVCASLYACVHVFSSVLPELLPAVKSVCMEMGECGT